MIKHFTVLLSFLLLVICAYAQNPVTGKVTDTMGQPLPGANVFIKGTNVGTFTDADGKFLVVVPTAYKDSTLIVSMVGYINHEVIAGSQTNMDVILTEDLQTLSEIVITGYTAQEKDKITGAVNTVAPEALVKLPVPSIDQALQGRAPGVVVSQNTGAPGEGVSVRIRGVGSINSSNNPLYIVDGVPTLDINNFSMQDVASVTVLKDASAAAIYGSRAANGVVVITTKSGTSSKPKIEFNTQFGIQRPSRLIEMANTDEYVTVYNEAATTDNAPKSNPLFHRKLITEDIKGTLDNVDYIDAIMQDGVLQTHSLSISGQENKTQYFVSFNYFDQEGIIKSSDYNRISGRANISSQVKDWLKTGINLNVAKSTTNLIGSSGDGAGGNGGSVIRYAFFRTPAIPIYDANGEFTDKPARFDLFGDGYSPVGMLAYNRNKRLMNQAFGRVFFDITPLDGFKFTTNLGFDISNSNQRRFDRNWGTDNRINNPNRLSVWSNSYQNTTWSNLLSYTKEVGDHNFTALLGSEAIKIQSSAALSIDRQFPDQTDALVYLGNGLGLKETDESRNGNSLLSYFGKLEYQFKEKYTASATLRRDGSSRFGPDNRWGNFYATSLGWRIDKESFLADNNFIDKLHLRAGYGKIGNQEIGDYPYTDIIGSGYNYTFGNSKAVGYAVNTLGNNKIKWESSTQLNAGVDVAVMEGKLQVSLDYFNKVTTDLLVKQPIASSSGQAESPWVNNGKVLNRGVEILASYNNEVGKLRYSVSANAATLHNEVLELNTPITGGAIGSDKITYTEEGYPIGSFYILEMEGIFQSDGQVFTHAIQGKNIKPGDVMYRDQDGNSIIDAQDRAHVGSAIPKVTAGLNINLNYGNWDLSLFFQGAYGQKIFSVLNRDIEGFYRAFNVTQRYYDNRWTGPGSTNEYPRASWDASGNNTKFSTRFLENGSYTRLKNLQIGYTLPSSMLERARIASLRVYFSTTNLLTLTKYSGMDPEMTVSDNSRAERDRAAGMDWGTYPSAKSYNIGVNLTF